MVRPRVRRFGDKVAVGLDVRGETLHARGWTRPAATCSRCSSGSSWPDAAGTSSPTCSATARSPGPTSTLLLQVCERTERPVIASGGVSKLDDLRALASLEPVGVEGVIVGKALYAGAFTVDEALATLRGAS